MAPDPVKVDPAHYKVEFENAQVRVLRIKYGPRERSVMHGHPASVGVHLTDGHVRFTFPNGKTEEVRFKAGEVRAYPAGVHLPENLGDEPLELAFVEPKARPATKKPAAAPAAKKPAATKVSPPLGGGGVGNHRERALCLLRSQWSLPMRLRGARGQESFGQLPIRKSNSPCGSPWLAGMGSTRSLETAAGPAALHTGR